jgi:8-amino-7-oxononanoate synthase
MTMSAKVPHLDDVLADLLARRQSLNRLRRLTTVPPGTTNFSSNAYLSLSSHPEVQRAFLARLEAAITADTSAPGLLGSGGSRLLDGNSELAESLESSIAAFHHAPAGLLFNSAMDANIGLFSCVPQSGDVVVYDELIHASVHDGMRLSRSSRRVPFAHNCVYGGPSGIRDEQTGVTNRLTNLETVLRGLWEPTDEVRNVFVVVEALYSMDGDLAPLKDIVECVERCLPRGNGYIIVDEAHSTGIFGDKGRGLVSELGLENRVWARVLGFGKAMGCAGGTFRWDFPGLRSIPHLASWMPEPVVYLAS